MVLSDFNILGFEGLQVIDAVRIRDLKVPVVIVTGTGSEEVAVKAMKRGAADYVIKSPQHIRRLPYTIYEVIEKKRLQVDRQQAEQALRESEERFDLAVRGSTDGLWDWPDMSVDKTWWSPRYFELLGYKEGDFEPNILTLEELLHPDDLERASEAWRLHLEEQQPLDMEYRLRTKSGVYRWFRSRGMTVRDEDGEPIRMAGSIQDITERKQAEAALETANAELTRAANEAHEMALVANAASQAKNEFLANTSHELRTPLTGIIGLLQILNSDLSASREEESEFIESALDTSLHLLEVVNDVLDISNVEAGRLEINLERVRLADVLDEVKKTTGLQARQKGLALQFQVLADLYVQADPVRLQQVLLNLVGNALKFTDSGEVSVNAQPAPDPDYALIEITDTGVGIAPQFLPRAFE